MQNNFIDKHTDRQNYQESYCFYNSPIILVVLLVVIPMVVVWWWLYFYSMSSLYWRVPWLTILIVGLFFSHMKHGLYVDQNGVHVTISIFDIRTHHIPLARISSIETVHFRTVFDWRGVGSCYGDDGKWTFLKVTPQGVVIKTTDGKEHIFESRCPQYLKDAICRFQKNN